MSHPNRSLALLAGAAAPLVWRASALDAAGPAGAVRATGHAALDAELPGGGWPAAGLTELLLPAAGCGELRLLAPAFAGEPLLWCLPPAPAAAMPCAPALARWGLAVDRLALVRATCAADAAWAAEQALRSGAFTAVWWWAPHASTVVLRRLHLAAQEGATALLALRPSAARAQSSPAPLRLALAPCGPGLAVDVFKRRGPPMAAPLVLALSLGAGTERARAGSAVPKIARHRAHADAAVQAAALGPAPHDGVRLLRPRAAEEVMHAVVRPASAPAAA